MKTSFFPKKSLRFSLDNNWKKNKGKGISFDHQLKVCSISTGSRDMYYYKWVSCKISPIVHGWYMSTMWCFSLNNLQQLERIWLELYAMVLVMWFTLTHLQWGWHPWWMQIVYLVVRTVYASLSVHSVERSHLRYNPGVPCTRVIKTHVSL